MREKLIELLQNAPSDFEGNKNVSTLADYLLANGVIVPPCKVGDIVYIISRGDIVDIKIVSIQYINKRIDISGRNEKYFGYSTITLDSKNEVGKKWYTTKEEAEKALERMENHE